MEILKWCGGELFTLVCTLLALRESIFLVLREKMPWRDVFILALLMEVTTLVIIYGVGFAADTALQNEDAVLPVTIVLWAGCAVAHMTLLAFRLDVTVL